MDRRHLPSHTQTIADLIDQKRARQRAQTGQRTYKKKKTVAVESEDAKRSRRETERSQREEFLKKNKKRRARVSGMAYGGDTMASSRVTSYADPVWDSFPADRDFYSDPLVHVADRLDAEIAHGGSPKVNFYKDKVPKHDKARSNPPIASLSREAAADALGCSPDDLYRVKCYKRGKRSSKPKVKGVCTDGDLVFIDPYQRRC
jgi:hypothetical protein